MSTLYQNARSMSRGDYNYFQKVEPPSYPRGVGRAAPFGFVSCGGLYYSVAGFSDSGEGALMGSALPHIQIFKHFQAFFFRGTRLNTVV